MITNGHSLQTRGIQLLRKYGAPEELLWLCEVQSIKECARYYGKFVLYDLTANAPNNHTHIIYQHENGYICQSATFDPNDPKSFEKAAEWLAQHI